MIKKLLTITVGASVLLTSCLKDKNITDDRKYGMEGISDVKLVEIVETPSKTYALDYRDVDTSFTLFTIHLNSEKPAEQDINVTLTINDQIVDDYNADNGTAFEVAPSPIYSLGNLTVTIPKGSREASVVINTNPADLSLGEYALGFTLSSVSAPGIVVSKNYSNLFVYLGVKNKYDGKYTLNGKFYHPTQSPNYGAFTMDAEMHTTSPTKVKLYIPDFEGYYAPGLFGGALNAFGAQEPEFTIDPTTNKVTVQNGYVGAVTFYTMAPGYDSHYDPVTKTIYAKWGYNYNPGPTFNPAANREWEYELIYEGPR